MTSRFTYLFLFVFLFLNTTAFANEPIHIFVPFSGQQYKAECSNFFNESNLFKDAISCGKNIADIDIKEDIKLPKCYIIKKEAPDVHKEDGGNYISLFLIGYYAILGFYEPADNTIFIVENYDKVDMEKIYSHELGHYFLHLAYGKKLHDGDPAHAHKFWYTCSSRTY